MAGKFEMYKDKAGKFRYRLKSGNGQNILSGQAYASQATCKNGIAAVQSNSGNAKQYERKASTSGKHYFVLKAKNHQVIGQSQMYDSAASMENGIQSVMSNGPTDSVDNQAG